MIECCLPGCRILFKPMGRKRFCHPNHKLQAHRAEVRAGKVPLPHHRPPEPDFGARVLPIAFDWPAFFAYADPAYPGKAHLYPENEEVDHPALIRSLVEQCPDGWALSTGSRNLQEVLPMCPAGVRVGSWHRQHRPYLERPYAWEPVIFCGGRRTPECVPDFVDAPAPTDWHLPGKKPPKFYRWVFQVLGLRPGDELFEPFPGSGGGAEALKRYAGDID